MDSQKCPDQFSATGEGCRANHHGRTAGSAMHSSRCKEVAISLKANTEGRGHDRLPCHWQVMQGIVKAKRETHHDDGSADFYFIQLLQEVAGPKRLQEDCF